MLRNRVLGLVRAYRILMIVTLLLVNMGCEQHKNTETPDIDNEIRQLSTIKDKEKYLLNIYEVDQKIRGDKGDAILLEKGHASTEYQELLREMMEIDYRNLAKIEAYLKLYGHPLKAEMTEKAVMTPWLVIHHASDYEPRVRNYEFLYDAYKNENIDEGMFSMFLARMYERKFGERLDMGGSYLEKDKIAIMIEKLELN